MTQTKSKRNVFLPSQKPAARFIHNVFDRYMKSHGAIRPHLILSGSSGSGKGYILDTLVAKHKFNFVNINAAQLTKEGISGNSLSKCLEPLIKCSGKPTVVLFDEFDKLFMSGEKATGEERSGVQTEILHIISSGKAQVIGDYGHYNQVNTSKCLFLFAGAFGGRQSLSPERLLELGMIPELLGRVNLHQHIPDINPEELITAAITDPLLMQYAEYDGLAKEGKVVDKTKFKAAADSIANQIRKEAQSFNIIGYRLIHRVIHQYFLYDGNYPEYLDETPFELDEAELAELNKQIDFGG